MKSTINTVRISVILACLALSGAARANEADTFCQLSQAQAKTSSAILAAPEVFGNMGDPVTAERSMTVGVRNSVARTRRADLTEKLAAAECAAFRAESRLAEQVSGVESRAELMALIHMEPKIKAALAAANENLQTEQKLLASRNARLSDVKTAFEQVDSLTRELATLNARRARIQNQLPEVEEPLQVLLQDSISTQADVADLAAKMVKTTSWDVTYAAGVRADLRDSGSQKGFVAVTATWSLGKSESDAAAARVAGLSTQLLHEKRDGAMQSFLRAKDSVRGLIGAETLTLDSLNSRKALLVDTQARVAGVDTTEGERLKRAVAVELMAIDASLTGASARLAFLTEWLARNDQ